MYDFLVTYTNRDGQLRTYGGLGHLIEARSKQEARAKVIAGMPPQVSATWTQIEVRSRYA
jgi:hypothetical protein